MSQTIVITEVEFEGARAAFVEAWHEQDRLLRRLGIKGAPGTRTGSGLTAALRQLGIKVEQ